LPDDGSSGGTRQTIAQLNSAIGSKAAVYGWYAQAHSGVPFDGSQLLAVIDDVKACNCVFQPAVMPIGGWKGLTSGDNSQAIAMFVYFSFRYSFHLFTSDKRKAKLT
jgi:hypothetical protein